MGDLVSGFRSFSLAMLLCGLMAFVITESSSGQDKEEGAPREAEVAKRIESCGGKIMQISSADSSREVSFYLAGKKVKDEHIKEISVLKDVAWLNLANTGITDKGLKEIAGLNLTKLHLEKTGIGDAGLVHLKGMKNLEYLNLYSTAVTDAGLKHLEGLPSLKKLYVWQSKVTPPGMKTLESKIKGLKVVGESKLPVAPPPAEKKKEGEPKPKKEVKPKKEAEPQTPQEKLKAREQAVKRKEAELKAKEEALKKREAALKKQEQEVKTKSDKG